MTSSTWSNFTIGVKSTCISHPTRYALRMSSCMLILLPVIASKLKANGRKRTFSNHILFLIHVSLDGLDYINSICRAITVWASHKRYKDEDDGWKAILFIRLINITEIRTSWYIRSLNSITPRKCNSFSIGMYMIEMMLIELDNTMCMADSQSIY
jgi:hypothetical protein